MTIRMHADLGYLLNVSGIGVVSIDPGDTTGMAWTAVPMGGLISNGVTKTLQEAKEQLRFDSWEVGKSGRSPWPVDELELADRIVAGILQANHKALTASSGKCGIDVVVLEDFVLSHQSQERSLLSPVRLLPLICDKLHREEASYDVVLQTAGNAMSVVTDDRLKRWGLYVEGSEHRKDAIRHMILFLRRLLNDSA